MNPRLCLSLQETGDVVMALNQHTAMDPKVIGFTGYPLTPSGKQNYFWLHHSFTTILMDKRKNKSWLLDRYASIEYCEIIS